jgi:hypothetical protein
MLVHLPTRLYTVSWMLVHLIQAVGMLPATGGDAREWGHATRAP